MNEPAEALLRQPLCKVAELTSADIPVEPGVYAWYRSGRLFYVGESHRGLRSRLWGTTSAATPAAPPSATKSQRHSVSRLPASARTDATPSKRSR